MIFDHKCLPGRQIGIILTATQKLNLLLPQAESLIPVTTLLFAEMETWTSGALSSVIHHYCTKEFVLHLHGCVAKAANGSFPHTARRKLLANTMFL